MRESYATSTYQHSASLKIPRIRLRYASRSLPGVGFLGLACLAGFLIVTM